MSHYRSVHLLAPEYQDLSPLTLSDTPPPFDLASIRAKQQALIAEADQLPNQPDGQWTAPAEGQQPAVTMYVYYPKQREQGEPLPLIYYAHGGGYVMGHARMKGDVFLAMADATGAVVVSVEYRVACEQPFPAQVNDAYHSLRYLVENAESLGIVREQIVLMGDSGGGGLIANLSLMVRDKNAFGVAGQVLIYPMLDCRTGGAQSCYQSRFTGEFVWTAEQNQTAWAILRNRQEIAPHELGYYSASLATDLSGLPPTCIITASLDLFANENLDFANRLIEAGVPTELHLINGVYHDFNSINPTSPQTQNFIAWRNGAVKSMFSGAF